MPLFFLKKINKIDTDTWIFPLVEMGQLGIHHDSVITKRLLSTSLSGSEMKLATGYFNLTRDFMDTITNNCLAVCNILMAHPNVSLNLYYVI
jgi:CDP-diacylglycerol---glycerol-3-phosphate 3-phosphatidyltransferase